MVVIGGERRGQTFLNAPLFGRPFITHNTFLFQIRFKMHHQVCTTNIQRLYDRVHPLQIKFECFIQRIVGQIWYQPCKSVNVLQYQQWACIWLTPINFVYAYSICKLQYNMHIVLSLNACEANLDLGRYPPTLFCIRAIFIGLPLQAYTGNFCKQIFKKLLLF